MMPTSIDLNLTVHRIGGDPVYPDRNWGSPNHVRTVSTAGLYTLSVDSTLSASRWLQVHLSDWTQVEEDWLGAHLLLTDVNGYPLGKRPVLVYTRPYDVFTYAQIHHPEAGLFSVALRCHTFHPIGKESRG